MFESPIICFEQKEGTMFFFGFFLLYFIGPNQISVVKTLQIKIIAYPKWVETDAMKKTHC